MDIINQEDIALQTLSVVVDASITIIGEAPQYTKVNNAYVLVDESMPYWSIKKISTSGATVLTRSANGDNKHNKIFSQWNSYTY